MKRKTFDKGRFHGKDDLPLAKIMEAKGFTHDVVNRGVEVAVEMQLMMRPGFGLAEAIQAVGLFQEDHQVITFLIRCWKSGPRVNALYRQHLAELEDRAEE